MLAWPTEAVCDAGAQVQYVPMSRVWIVGGSCMHLGQQGARMAILWQRLMDLQQKVPGWTLPEPFNQLLQLLCWLQPHTGAVMVTAVVTQPALSRAASSRVHVSTRKAASECQPASWGEAHRAHVSICLGDQIRLHLHQYVGGRQRCQYATRQRRHVNAQDEPSAVISHQ